MKYCFSTLSFEQVHKFLLETDMEFATPLSEKVNIDDYAKKLSEFSHFAYCIDEDKIIGMISCYTNNPPLGYISNVCVKSEYQNKGVFSLMFSTLIDSMEQLGIKILRLEVDNSNANAQNVYLRKGFVFSAQASEHSKYMEFQIYKEL